MRNRGVGASRKYIFCLFIEHAVLFGAFYFINGLIHILKIISQRTTHIIRTERSRSARETRSF